MLSNYPKQTEKLSDNYLFYRPNQRRDIPNIHSEKNEVGRKYMKIETKRRVIEVGDVVCDVSVDFEVSTDTTTYQGVEAIHRTLTMVEESLAVVDADGENITDKLNPFWKGKLLNAFR